MTKKIKQFSNAFTSGKLEILKSYDGFVWAKVQTMNVKVDYLLFDLHYLKKAIRKFEKFEEKTALGLDHRNVKIGLLPFKGKDQPKSGVILLIGKSGDIGYAVAGKIE